MIEIKTKCCGAVIVTGNDYWQAFQRGLARGESFRHADIDHIPMADIPSQVVSQVLLEIFS